MSLKLWTDNRFTQLQDAMGWSRAETLGVLVLLWHGTRTRELGRVPTREQVLAALPCAKERRIKVLQALVDADYIATAEEGLNVIDNAAYFDASDKMSVAGKRGGWPAHKTHPPKKKPKPKNPLTPSTAETWNAYSDAFNMRYGVEPLRNARVNAQLQQLVARVGKRDAPRLVRFFVSHEGRQFIRGQHSIGLLLLNAEGVFCQMQKDEPFTEHDEKSHSDSHRLNAQLQRFSASN